MIIRKLADYGGSNSVMTIIVGEGKFKINFDLLKSLVHVPLRKLKLLVIALTGD